jgi:hypothetical protein
LNIGISKGPHKSSFLENRAEQKIAPGEKGKEEMFQAHARFGEKDQETREVHGMAAERIGTAHSQPRGPLTRLVRRRAVEEEIADLAQSQKFAAVDDQEGPDQQTQAQGLEQTPRPGPGRRQDIDRFGQAGSQQGGRGECRLGKNVEAQTVEGETASQQPPEPKPWRPES